MRAPMDSVDGLVGEALTSIAVYQYYTTAAIALFYYEYLLTFSREVRFFWRSTRYNYVSVLFILLRYTTLFGYIPTLYFATSAPSSIKACDSFARFPGAMNTISLGIITIFLIIRTHAIYFRSGWVLFLTVPLGVVNVALAAWALTVVETSDFTIGAGVLRSCVPADFARQAPFVSSWPITVTFDTLISALTISKTYLMHRQYRREGMESRLIVMLLHDGNLYYSVMTTANIVNFVFFFVTCFDYFEIGAGNNSEMTHAISVVTVSRMMLNIMEATNPHHAYDTHPEYGEYWTRGTVNATSLHFTSPPSLGTSVQSDRLTTEVVQSEQTNGRSAAHECA